MRFLLYSLLILLGKSNRNMRGSPAASGVPSAALAMWRFRMAETPSGQPVRAFRLRAVRDPWLSVPASRQVWFSLIRMDMFTGEKNAGNGAAE